MGIREFDCPECGAATKVGIPKGSAVTTVRVASGGDDRGGRRQTVCPNGHEIEFDFDR